MEALYLLIPLSLVLIGLATWFFFRMSESGQFDDVEGPAHSILMDDDRPQASRQAAAQADQWPAAPAFSQQASCKAAGPAATTDTATASAPKNGR